DVNVRIDVEEGAHDWPDHHGCSRPGDEQAQVAAGRSAKFGQLVQGSLEILKELLRTSEQMHASFGQGNAASRSREEPHAELVFQSLYALTERGRRNAKFRRGAGKIEMACHSREGEKLAHFDGSHAISGPCCLAAGEHYESTSLRT